MNTLIMCVGLPASGKSTFSQHLSKTQNYKVVSSDEIRKELGDINDQSKNPDVFAIVRKRVKELLKTDDVCVDCTNLSRKFRMAFLAELKKIPCYKVCIFFAVPFEICMERNNKRDRVVPATVMWRMYKSINIPCKNEGFDEVVVINNHIGYYGDAKTKIQSLIHLDQDNPHHTLTLGDHCLMAYNHVCDRTMNEYVRRATLLHDVGKVKTKVWETYDHNPTTESHYYGHEHVSAYDSFFYTYNNDVMMYYEYLYIALLIELHMKPYVTYKESEKSVKTDKMLLGIDGWDDLMILHRYDKEAH